MKRTKKLLSIILSICILFSITTGIDFSAYAETTSGTCGDNVNWSYDSSVGLLTISGSGKMNNYSSSSDAPWYSYRSSIKYLILKNNITSIGNYAFYGCSGLTSVTIPNSVTSIGKYAFYNCTGLTSVTIGNSVKSIGDYAFSNCTGLTKVNINSIEAWCKISFNYSSSNPLYYAHDLYLNDELVTDLVIPDSVTSIGSYAFYGCTGLTSVTIPDSVTSIGNYAFYNSNSLTSITIPKNVSKIGNAALNCSELSKINVDSENKYYASIDGVLFNKDETKLEKYPSGNNRSSYVMPDSVTNICEYAFYGCTGLTSVTIPDSVTSIGKFAFCGCTGIRELTMPASAKIYYSGYTSEDTFSKCSNIEKVTLTKGTGTMQNYSSSSSSASDTHYGYTPWYTSRNSIKEFVIEDGVENIGSCAFYDCTGLTNVTIPNSVTSIGYSAFFNCTGLTSVTIGNGVESIGRYAFAGCAGLKRVNINSIESWCKIEFESAYTYWNDVSSNPLSYTDNIYLNNELVTDLVIPNSVTSISDYAFYNCKGLTSITMGSNITSIGYCAFSICTGLTSVTIPDSVTKIGACAFRECTGLTDIVIGNSATSIGSQAFYGCTGLTSITIPDSVTSIGDYTFYNCTNLTNATIGNSVTSLGKYTFSGCTNLTNATIGNSVTSLGSYTFSGCTSLKELTIPCSSKITSSVFGSCSNIEKVTLTKGTGIMQTYGTSTSSSASDTYYGYTPWYISRDSIKEIVIEDGVENIGNYAFYGCYNLINVTLGDNISNIGDYAFYNCTNLKNITIPSNVSSIGNQAFKYCVSLTKVNIDNIEAWCKIKFFDSDSNPVFYANNLYLNNVLVKELIIPNDITEINNYAFENCSSLVNVIISDGITSIGNYAFFNCTGLQELSMPCSAKIYNSEYTFYNCSNIKKLTLTNGTGSMQTYGTSASSSATNTYDRYTPWYISRNSIEELVIEDDVNSIDNSLIKYLTNLNKLYLHNRNYDSQTLVSTLPKTATLYSYDSTGANIYCPIYSINYVSLDKCEDSGHKYKLIETINATCIKEGKKTYKCSVCDIEKTETISLISHTPSAAIVENKNQTSCDVEGTYDCVVYCSYCNTELSREKKIITSKEHRFSKDIVKSSTCTEKGIEKYTCNDCLYSYETEIDLIAHTIVTDEKIEPTCISTGLTEGSHCSTCNEIFDEQKTIPIVSHRYETKTVAPNCMYQGYTEHKCSICGETYIDSFVQATDVHNYKSVITTQPTCTTTGVKTFTCSVCGNTYTEDINVVDHTTLTDKAVKATCKTSGLTEGSHCSTCGKVLVAQTTINAIGHTPKSAVEENRIASTCQKAGSVDSVVYCSTCDEELSRTTTVIPVAEHKYVQTVVAPTCEAKGYTLNKCADCGESYKNNFVDETDNHDYKSAITTQPTCTTKGVKTFTCTICGNTYTESIQTVEHTTVTDNAISATCNTSGLTEGSHCSTCGKILAAQTVVPVANHSYTQTTVAPTCETKGYTLNKCSSCGESYKDAYTDTVAHSYKEVTTMQPTCTEKGILKHNCVVCGDTYNTDIDMLEHTVAIDEAVEATCTKTGLTEGSHCSVCDTVLIAQTVVAKKAHTVVTDKAVASTYTKVGKTAGSHCSVCKAVIVAQKTVAKKTLAKPTSVKATAASKGFKLTWKKVSAATGYEIQYSTSSKFTNAKKVTISKNSTVSKTVSKLTAKKKYYVRIRAVVKDKNGTAYSAWVSTNVTTKK